MHRLESIFLLDLRAAFSDDIHLFNQKLCEWEDYYNYHRPHGTPRPDVSSAAGEMFVGLRTIAATSQ